MSASVPLAMMTQATTAAIKATRPHRPGCQEDPYPCGCFPILGERWHLCSYHDGYNDAAGEQPSGSRDVLNSVAFALCAHDESDEPDYGNDEIARWVTRQLVADGHVQSQGDDQ